MVDPMTESGAPRVFYEDIEVGAPQRFGHAEVTRDEVIAFAARYDPQPFHLDDAAAAASPFGRLAASGWHTCAMTMAMMVQYFHEAGLASLGGAGVDDLRWLKPVYPGDTLRTELVVSEKRRSASRPEMGLIRQQVTVFNQHDEPVLRFIANGMIAVRHPEVA